MLFPASPFLRLGYLRPAPRWWLAAFLPFLALLLQQPRSTEASASQKQSSIPGHPPPFLSLPTHPTFFLFVFSNLFFFFFKAIRNCSIQRPWGWIPHRWEHPRNLAASLPVLSGPHTETA